MEMLDPWTPSVTLQNYSFEKPLINTTVKLWNKFRTKKTLSELFSGDLAWAKIVIIDLKAVRRIFVVGKF